MVDLPEPFGPTKPKISPRRASMLTFCKAFTPLNDLETLSMVNKISPALPWMEMTAGATGVGKGGNARRLLKRLINWPKMPSGMNKITTIKIKPMAARPTTAESPAVNAYDKAVMAVAPTAGPSQWREPPKTLISTTYKGTTMLNTSPAVT